MSLTDRPRRGMWRIVTVVLTIAIGAMTGLGGVNHGRTRVLLLAGAVIAAVLQLYAGYLRDDAAAKAVSSAERLAEEIRAVTHKALAGTITPLLRLLAQIEEAATEAERRPLRSALLTAVVTSVPAVLAADNLRACFFAMEWDGNGVPKALTPVHAAGRADPPKTLFNVGTTAGDEAIQMVLDDSHQFSNDTNVDPPASWIDHPHEYRTFLSVPVRGLRQTIGMLSVDGLNPGDLVKDRDEPILTVLARILAVSQISHDEIVR
jgi:hypothetical protein